MQLYYSNHQSLLGFFSVKIVDLSKKYFKNNELDISTKDDFQT